MRMLEVKKIEVDNIYVPGRRRGLRDETVKDLATSMKKDGLLYPISIRMVEGPVLIDGEEVWSVPTLVAGGHRLAAAKLNKWREIDCQVLQASDIEAERIEIIENYARAELTLEERARDFHRLKELLQVEAVSGGAGRKGGVRDTARQLGMNDTKAQRLDKLGDVSDEAWDAAREAGIAGNQSAMLKVAAAEDQLEKVEEITRRNDRIVEAAPHPEDIIFDEFLELERAWDAAGDEARVRFMAERGLRFVT